MHESVNYASDIIHKGDTDNYLARMRNYSYDNSKVTFDIDGKTYTRNEFENGYKQILLGFASRF